LFGLTWSDIGRELHFQLQRIGSIDEDMKNISEEFHNRRE
jgi:hypothetical protein